jgi:hypothetical protein
VARFAGDNARRARASVANGGIRRPLQPGWARGGPGKTKVSMDYLGVTTEGRVLAVLESLEEVARELRRLGRDPTPADVSTWCDITWTSVRSWVLNPSSGRRRCHRSATHALNRPSLLGPKRALRLR